jgi:glucan phosphoethanolaminetransferase (alkaline phosphatase superfamily)
MKDVLLFLHPTFGVLGMLAALWVFVETLNASDANQQRIWKASLTVAVLFALTWFFAGWYYTVYYHSGDQQIIQHGPVPWAHDFFMETKEHLFFIPLILAFYLPFVARLRLSVKPAARNMVLVVAALITLNGLAIEGAGAIINWGAKTSMAQTIEMNTTNVKGAPNEH